MFQATLFTIFFILASNSYANKILTVRDWTVYKDVETALLKTGCLAETVVESESSGVTETWYLQVILMKTELSGYAAPIIVSYSNNIHSQRYFEATAQSDNLKTPIFSLTRLQPSNANSTVVSNRINDREGLLNRLKADNQMNVSFLDNKGVTKDINFSLRGSSKVIDTLQAQCQ